MEARHERAAIKCKLQLLCLCRASFRSRPKRNKWREAQGRCRLCRIWAGELAPALNTPIVVYCASGEHCTSAVQVLRDLGCLNVGSLIGGLQGWLEAGGLVESSGGRNSG